MYDVIVLGAGHAGIEAALASSRMGLNTALITLKKESIALMPCNPSVGGPAKGIVVREIEALGGQMGKTADATALQFKMLNTNKGPGVQSLRVQSDKLAYARMMRDLVEHQPHLDVIETLIEEVMVDHQHIRGVRGGDGTIYQCQALVLTTGTYMSSKVMISADVKASGPDGLATTTKLSTSLRNLGLRTFRLKTGTPPRVYTNTIDFSVTTLQPGDSDPQFFSRQTRSDAVIQKQVPCYLTYTNEATHQIIRDNLTRSSMYSGVVEGVGPRYCPSIEDKVVRFSDKSRHQLFLEPESLDLDTTYIQGFSSSLPIEVQEKMVHTIVGLEHCVVKKYAYAIEYDAIDPTQLKPSLETKLIHGLFCAGQINGTSGYEEAAGQGLIAGINAARLVQGRPALVLSRDQAYIGVMIDDLVTKGTKEPYRLLTSRAEYRLLLRHDNAYRRLSSIGHDIGLIPDAEFQSIRQELAAVDFYLNQFKEEQIVLSPALNAYLHEKDYGDLDQSITWAELIKRPNLHLNELFALSDRHEARPILHQAEVEIKYEGYIKKARKEADKLIQMERIRLPERFDYATLKHLSLEGRQKLNLIQPQTIGQASRISGVNPADISILVIALENHSLV